MKKNQLLLVLCFVATTLIMNSCSDSGDDDPNPCENGPEVSIDNQTPAVDGQSNGSITASATGGASPLMYSIDGTNFQSSGTFENLAAGNYTVTVKDANDCTDTENVTIGEVMAVSYANQIRPIIDTNCQISNCHGDRANLPSFATYDDVKNRASGIKARTGSGSMPPTGALPDSEIQLIADWVDQGALNN